MAAWNTAEMDANRFASCVKRSYTCQIDTGLIDKHAMHTSYACCCARVCTCMHNARRAVHAAASWPVTHLAANLHHFPYALVAWHAWQAWLQWVLALYCVDV